MTTRNGSAPFQAERADTVSRNIHHARPVPAGRNAISTPGTPSAAEKRSHDVAFPTKPSNLSIGEGLMKYVTDAVKYLKDNSPKTLPYERIISYISLPNDLRRKEHLLHRALKDHPRMIYTPSARTAQLLARGQIADEEVRNKDSFKYRPLHPVTNPTELRAYLATLDTAHGIPVKELKDGWPDCVPALINLEAQGHVLLLRNKKDGTPRTVWPDSPAYHILSVPPKASGTSSLTADETPPVPLVKQADDDFKEKWAKIRLPANENDLRLELERANLTPTSVVREVRTVEVKKRERKRVERKNGKKTNVHMTGILKDYSKMRPGGR
ncbi:hypothetical protein M433DRAFT_164252 [Acidomyces richmondensis BFW]|nr:MAG: hypothetical protein FE78DRAFT_104824 [Acidomyces sp. 'richmondensis']KYG47524.1 hypothetical protein M433DRAFT_164252 [Acidomyces richmondensis BFW]